MIFDDFKNIKKYNIDKKVLDFILNIDKNIEAKRHIISDSAYINIDEYQTRNKIKLEAHKKYIDIQFMIEGSERVFVTDLADLEVMEKYDENKDVEFYQTPKRRLNSLYLTKNKFIISKYLSK